LIPSVTVIILTDNSLEAVANIELTREGNGRPNNSVHFHVLTDTQRSESELRKLFETACERQGLVKGKDFWITYRVLYDGYEYFDYFTKYGKHSREVILFVKGTGLDKFYQIGKWFGKSKKGIWKEYIRERYGTDPDKIDKSIIVPEIDELSGELSVDSSEPEQDRASDKENEPPQSVIPENLYPPPITESQRAMAAHDVWVISKNGGVQKQTLDAVARQFNVSRRMVQRAVIVKKGASESINQSVRNGTARLSKAVNAVKTATETTGITVTPSTSDTDKKMRLKRKSGYCSTNPANKGLTITSPRFRKSLHGLSESMYCLMKMMLFSISFSCNHTETPRNTTRRLSHFAPNFHGNTSRRNSNNCGMKLSRQADSASAYPGDGNGW